MTTRLTSALVTGASAGIGTATVRALTGAGIKTWAMARRADRLEALAAETACLPLVADVQDGPGLEAALADVDADILINNAGLGAGITGLMGASRDDLDRTIGTNVTALLDVTRLVLPGMAERGRGHIVNIGSVAGLYPINSAVYGGSKGAVHLISQNLRLELRGTGVRVTEINPGRVATEFMDVAVPPGADFPAKTPITELTSDDIAAAILYAVQAPAHVNVSMIELQPTEQTFGATQFDPLDWPD
ncbi:MAG: SDR family oxidoreductase, partial [Pseudomonadota bacterium]